MGCTRDMEEEVFECHHVLFDRLSTAAAEATNEATSAFLSEVLLAKGLTDAGSSQPPVCSQHR
jgi:hypothetical protein